VWSNSAGFAVAAAHAVVVQGRGAWMQGDTTPRGAAHRGGIGTRHAVVGQVRGGEQTSKCSACAEAGQGRGARGCRTGEWRRLARREMGEETDTWVQPGEEAET
jgi:hypothetical protein